ncbi:MAG: sigma 54-interacting transcriptional regulator [Myxococcota bacterium]
MVEAVFPEPRNDRPEERETPLRARERDHLIQRLDADHGGSVVLRGPRGVGKESLAADLVRHAKQLAKTVVFQGKALQAGGRSFHPFAEVVRQATTWAEQAGLSEALVDPLLEDLHPVLDHHGSEPGTAPTLDLKLRFFEGVRRLLSGLSERARVLIVIHDLERADGDTLELASYLADNLFGDPALDTESARPGLLLLLCRDDRTTAPRAKDFLADLEERRSVETMRLQGLDYDGLRQYLQSPRVLEKVMQASEGLPREIDELFDALPSNVEQLFVRRLDAMSALERSVLRALSLADRPASARILSAVTSQAVKDVAHALGAHKEARILERRIHNGELEFSFVRRSNLEVTAKTASPEELAQLHTGWANALASSASAADPSLLAHHQLRSTEPLRGVPLAIRAAESHAVSGAFDAAAGLLEEALPHASKGELRITILARLSELASLRGKPREAVRYVEMWKAELPDSEQGRALIREAQLKNASGEYDLALQCLSEARQIVPESQRVDRAAVECAAAEALYQRGTLDEAARTGERCLSLLDALGADAPVRDQIEAMNLLGKIALGRDDAKGAERLFRDTLSLAERTGLIRQEARALVNIGYAEMRSAGHVEAERTLLLAVEKAHQANELKELAFGTLNLGVIAHLRGELGRAIEHYRGCRSLFQRLGNRTQLARVLLNLSNLYATVGDLRRSRAHLDEASRLAQAGGVERMIVAAMAADGTLRFEEGDHEGGETRLREAMVHQKKLGSERPLETLVELASLQLRRGDIEAAEEALAEPRAALPKMTARRLVLRTKLCGARLDLVTHHPDAIDALEAVRDELALHGDRFLLRDAELALGLALSERGQKELARLHLMAAIDLQKRVAQELPSELKELFESAPPQQEAKEALARLTRPTSAITTAEPKLERALPPPPPPVVEDRPLSIRPSSPAPAARTADWEKKYGAIVGSSPKLFRVFHILDRVASSENTVLIIGESGTGKELIAEAAHRNSPRHKGPFVKLNCAALVESLLLSELFGHERGSFTGAHQRKVGRFEMAAGGTIFLDEIGDISPKTQVALLRVLQEREFERVGGGRPIRLEARVVCATNRNLPQMVKEGTFREDLYYRLKGLSIELPPLRERPEDIEALANTFLARYAVESSTPQKMLSAGASGMLRRYSWPGNVRELENVIRSVALFADAQVIDKSDFDEYRELFEDAPAFEKAVSSSLSYAPASTSTAEVAPPPPRRAVVPTPEPVREEDAAMPAPPSEAALLARVFHEGVPLAELKRKIQAEAIARALTMSKGNITKAADILGMKRPRLSQIINANEELKELVKGVGR